MEIILTKGMVAVIDDTDAPLVSGRHWTAMRLEGKRGTKWYAKATGPDRTTILMHRVILNAAKGQLIDHKDGNGLNNRRDNIRFANSRGNASNRRSQSTPHRVRSEFRGVYQFDNEHGFIAKLRGERLGKFADAKTAALAWDAAARVMYGNCARLNFPNEGELAAFEPEVAAPTLTDSSRAKPARKLLPADVVDILDRYRANQSPTSIARDHSIDRRLVYAIVKGEMWNHITGIPKAA